MIFKNRITQVKLVEQLTLVTLQTAHHGSTSPRIASSQRNHASPPVSTDFCNKIRQKKSSAFEAKGGEGQPTAELGPTTSPPFPACSVMSQPWQPRQNSKASRDWRDQGKAPASDHRTRGRLLSRHSTE